MAFQAKRRFQRSVQREAVKILSPAGIEYATYEDLSIGGLKLWVDHDWALETILSLEFSLVENGRSTVAIKALGRVVRCIKAEKGFEVGIQFIDLNVSTRSALERQFADQVGPF